jgi:hypothetical protein
MRVGGLDMNIVCTYCSASKDPDPGHLPEGFGLSQPGRGALNRNLGS